MTVAQRPSTGDSWSTAETLSVTGTGAAFPQLAVAPSGAAVVVWQETHALGLRDIGSSYIEASVRRSADGVWSTPTVISQSLAGAPDVSVEALSPQVAIAKSGDATVVWISYVRDASQVDVVDFDHAKATWSVPGVLESQRVSAAHVAMDARGDVVVVWRDSVTGAVLSGTSGKVVAKVRVVGMARWSPLARLGSEVELSGEGTSGMPTPDPRVSMDPRGDALAVWQGGTRRTPDIAVAVWNAHMCRWSAEPPITPGYGTYPAIAADAAGYATVAWLNRYTRVAVSSRAIAGCCWSKPATLDDAPSALPSVAVDGAGNAVVTWSTSEAEAAIRRGKRGRWRGPIAFGRTVPWAGGGSTVSIDEAGDGLVAWADEGPPKDGYVNVLLQVANLIL
jgi:hypothetical protein